MGMIRRQRLIAFVFVVPFIVIFGLYTLLPTVIAVAISLTNLTTMQLHDPLGARFVGLANFVRILKDPLFLQAMRTTVVIVVIAVPLTMSLGLGLATALNRRIGRFKALFRGGFYVPVVVNMVAIGVIWKYAFDDQGLINSTLQSLGLT